MSVIDLLEAERGVRQSITMMSRAVDDEDWETVHRYLNADFQLDGVIPPIRGADMMLTMMKEAVAQAAGVKTQHILGNMIVTVGSDEAQASAFQTMYRYRAGEFSSPLSKIGSRVVYRLRQEQGAWKIVSFSFVRLWVEGDPS
jgi:SOS-response transcriptional repressor LexA